MVIPEPQTDGAKWVENSPDKRPSSNRYLVDDCTPDVVRCVLEVREHGALVLRVTKVAPGLWDFNGVSLFTNEEIQFD